MKTSTTLVPERVDALEHRARREIDEGLLPSCQFAIAKDGEVLVHKTFGDATDDTRYCIFSSTKAVTASAFWMLLGEGLVATSDKVADLLPNFGENGKQDITVEHVLLHTAGFPNAIMSPKYWTTHAERLEVYRHWRLDWEPGTRYAYHGMAAHWVLMDILVELAGSDYRPFIRERICEPIGLTSLRVGIPPEEQTNLAEVRYVGDAMTPDEMEAAFGFRSVPAPRGSLASMGDFGLLLNEPLAREVGIPGGGGFSTAADVTLFYQELLLNSKELWDPEVLADGTQRVRNNMPDPLYKIPAGRALGTILAGDDGHAHARGFGRTFSPRAFGHGGAGGQIAIADPETGISFCYLTNGHDRHQLRQGRRGVALASLAGLVTTPADYVEPTSTA